MAPKRAAPKRAPPKVHFTVESIDVDGDSIPDGDMVSKYVDGVLVSRKFVPLTKLKRIARNAAAKSRSSSRPPRNAPPNAPRNAPPNAPRNARANAAPDNRVIVQEDTGFGQYIKAGAGMEAGRVATDAVVDGLMGLFGGDDW